MQRSSAIRRTFAAAGVILFAFVLPVSAASAHDSLTGSNPEDGQKLQAMPDVVELTFSQPPLGMGSEMKVEDASGKDWAAGDVEIIDNVARQGISPDAPAGKYTVTWRVVSSDSHPIEGTFTFTAASAGPGGSPGGAAVGSPAPLASDSAVPGGGDSQANDPQPASTTFPTSFVVIMGALLVILIVIIGFMARRRLGRHEKAAPGEPPPADEHFPGGQ